MGRRRRVRVPGSSANLGPGYDAMAAAVSVHLQLEVEEADGFSVDVGDQALPTDETNLCVVGFADLHEVDRHAFRMRSEIPLAAGLGSSAAVKSDVVPPPDAPSVATRCESTSGRVAR